jgi:peptide/nickel transport system substrate-binding protein
VSDGGKTITIKLRPGVKFNDGTPMNAEAVRYSLDRHLNMKGSNRRSELESINSIDVADDLTVRLKLKAPFSRLVAILADRAGMPVSPAVATKLGDKFGTAPVCVGPWQFVERIAQDRIVLERSPHYFDKGAAKFDRLVFRIIPDDNVRLANLRSGDIDVMHLVGPTDAANLKKDGKYEVSSVTGIGYDGLTINLHNKTGKPPQPPGTAHPRQRPARARGSDFPRPRRPESGGGTASARPPHPISPVSPRMRAAKSDARRAWRQAPRPTLPGASLEMVIVDRQQRRARGDPGLAKEAGFNISLALSSLPLNDNDGGRTRLS